MYSFHVSAGGAVAADTKRAVTAIDAALLQDTQLLTTLIEAVQGSNMPISKSQDIIQSATEGLTHFVAGRASMVTTIRKLNAVKGRSDFAPVDYGCPEGFAMARMIDADATPCQAPVT